MVTFPYDMPPDQIAAQAQRLYAEAQGKEPSLTRERQTAGAPSALDAGHHPDTLATERFGTRIPGIQEALQRGGNFPSDAAFLKRGPEVGGAAGMMLGGPLGAAAGAGLGSLAKGQQAQGAHVPTGGDVATAGGDALWGGLLASAPGLVARGARAVGPTLTNNAKPIAKGMSALTGLGAGVASGNPITGLGVAAATRALTSPGVIKGAGTAATRVGMMPSHVTNKIGFGALSADAFRKALLDALGEDPASAAVP
jgi:hypothetical protein